MWDAVGKLIDTYDSFLITCHVNPDGDAIGSEVALKAYLEDRDKTAIIVNASPTPGTLAFLDPDSEIKVFGEMIGPEVLDDVDAVFLLDFSTWDQLGNLARPLQRSSLPRVCIDHHVNPDDDFADVMASDTTAAATGVLVYELIEALGGEVSRAQAVALYTALITDTGTFRFSNTDARVFRVAATLTERGATPVDLYKAAFGSKSWGTGRLLGPVLSTVQSAADGRLVWIHATLDMVNTSRGSYDDMDGFADLVRAIDGVELVLFFKETGDGNIKVSLRSNGNVDAYVIAEHFGGGGHRMASGMRVDGPMNEAIDKVVGLCLQMDGIRERPE
jgi:nanoRNase/pAp phosphatase (c-di-AMP/oligoRNAs hydrolase)